MFSLTFGFKTTTTLWVHTRDSLLTVTQFSSGSQSHPSLPIILPGTIEQHTMCHPTKDGGCSGWFLGLCLTMWVHTSSAALILQQIQLNLKSWFPEACVCKERDAKWKTLEAVWVSLWNNCPLRSSSKDIFPLTREVPVNYFLCGLLPSPSASLNSSSADVTNCRWRSSSCMTVHCGEWFVWVVIVLGVFELLSEVTTGCALLFFLLLCLAFCHSSSLPSLKTPSISAPIFRLSSSIYLILSYPNTKL